MDNVPDDDQGAPHRPTDGELARRALFVENELARLLDWTEDRFAADDAEAADARDALRTAHRIAATFAHVALTRGSRRGDR